MVYLKKKETVKMKKIHYRLHLRIIQFEKRNKNHSMEKRAAKEEIREKMAGHLHKLLK